MDMCVQILLQQMSALQQHQQSLVGASSNRGPELKCLAALSKPGTQVQSRLLQLPTGADSLSSLASSEQQSASLQIYRGVARADSQQFDGPSPVSPAPQPLQPSFKKMNSNASMEDSMVLFDLTESTDDGGSQVAGRQRLLDDERANAEMSSEVSVVGGAHRLADVPTHRPADVSIVVAHRLADASFSDGPPVANELPDAQDKEAIVPAAPVRSKASMLLQEFTDMHADRATRKRGASKPNCNAEPETHPKKSRTAKTDGPQAMAKTSAKQAAKATAKVKAKASAGPAEVEAHKGHKKPVVSHERSRNQFCARNGTGGPGSSRLFKYDPNDAASKEQAEKDAKAWVEEVTKK